MNIDLRGKQALVSGSTAGIGLAIAKGLALAGARVTLNGRSEARVSQAIATVKQAAPEADVQGIVADLASAAGCEALIAQLPQTDILINSLGYFAPGDFFQLDDEAWLSMFELNVLSAVRLSRHYGPGMARRGWGRIQFLSSESAVQPSADLTHYAMSKAALLAVSRGLATAMAGSGVTVNAVLPGPTRSEGVSRMLGGDTAGAAGREAEFMQRQRPTSLIKRLADPEEVASLVVYLASPQASATTGAALRVDGGVWPSIL